MSRERFRYSSRREKNEKVRRNVKLILIFAGLWLLVWLMMNRHDILGLLKTYTY
jgi:hypothetical protein